MASHNGKPDKTIDRIYAELHIRRNNTPGKEIIVSKAVTVIMYTQRLEPQKREKLRLANDGQWRFKNSLN